MTELSIELTKQLTQLHRIQFEGKKCKELQSLDLLFIFYQHLSSVNMGCFDLGNWYRALVNLKFNLLVIIPDNHDWETFYILKFQFKNCCIKKSF